MQSSHEAPVSVYDQSVKLTALRAVAPLALFAAVLSGCASSDPAVSSDLDEVADVAQDAQESADTGDAVEDSSSSGIFAAYESITSCDAVAAVVAPYIEGLEFNEEDSGVGQYGTACFWVPPEDNTDWDLVREIDVVIEDAEGSAEPDLSLFLEMEGTVVHDDPWVEANGGVAYSLTLGTSVGGASVHTIWLPEVEVSIGGGQWGDYPALDGPAAIQIAKELLGG